MNFNVALHLFFNRDVSLPKARRTILRCFRTVDRRLYGTNFNLAPADQRTGGVFLIEHVDSNLHAHGLLRVCDSRLGQFADMFPPTGRGLWAAEWEGGSQTMGPAHDPAGFADYITKEQTASAPAETMLWLHEGFRSAA